MSAKPIIQLIFKKQQQELNSTGKFPSWYSVQSRIKTWQPKSCNLGFLVMLEVKVQLLARVTLLCSCARQCSAFSFKC